MKKEDESDLLISIREGNSQAFRQVYDHYGKKLFYFARSMNLDQESAEEIVQETFTTVWANRRKLKPEYSFNAYLMTIARNLIYNGVRREALMKRYVKNMEGKPTEYTHLQDNELNGIVNEILILLPDKCQQVFKMSRLEGYSNQEIADKLSISKSTVENHLNKALNLFRKHLKRYDIGFLILYLLNL